MISLHVIKYAISELEVKILVISHEALLFKRLCDHTIYLSKDNLLNLSYF